MPRGRRPRNLPLWASIASLLRAGLRHKAIVERTGRPPGTVSSLIRALRMEDPTLPQGRSFRNISHGD